MKKTKYITKNVRNKKLILAISQILLFGILLTSTVQSLFSQSSSSTGCPPSSIQDPCSECRGKSFPYRFCNKDDKTGYTWNCTCNPKRSDIDPDYKLSFMGANIPVKLCYDAASISNNKHLTKDKVYYSFVDGQTNSDGSPKLGSVMFNCTDAQLVYMDLTKSPPVLMEIPTIQDVCDKAAKAYNDLYSSLCGGSTKSGQTVDCPCIKVVWSTNEDFINKQTKTASLALTSVVRKEGTNCTKADCDKTIIELDARDEFWKGDDNNYPSMFYMDGRFKLQSGQSTIAEIHYNLLNVVTHELGHILGFGHPNGSEGCSGSICNKYKGIMDKEPDNSDDRGLSDDDKCMFKLAYCNNCPAIPPSEEKCKTKWGCLTDWLIGQGPIRVPKDNGPTVEIRRGITIRLPDDIGTNVQYKIITENLDVVGNSQITASSQNLNVATQGLADGKYYMVIWNDLNYTVSEFVIKN